MGSSRRKVIWVLCSLLLLLEASSAKNIWKRALHARLAEKPHIAYVDGIRMVETVDIEELLLLLIQHPPVPWALITECGSEVSPNLSSQGQSKSDHSGFFFFLWSEITALKDAPNYSLRSVRALPPVQRLGRHSGPGGSYKALYKRDDLAPPPVVDWLVEPKPRWLGGNGWLLDGPEEVLQAETCSTTEDGAEPLLCPSGYECHILSPGDMAKGIPNRGQCVKQGPAEEPLRRHTAHKKYPADLKEHSSLSAKPWTQWYKNALTLRGHAQLSRA
ncbi:PREDICTED: WAP four-disulfide core domain protein 1 [Myotis brandtii]|uniref:WAP four-disulfide core domain protein 1 n=1 Tax=Myotis brandtii TaxID=109478 RepID=UPI000703DA87|nr:PREDICTED: WAP four-disulfide core domain protein 1 [Myotis brandtii]